MIVNYDSFARASTFIHSLQGGAFLLLGAAELYALKKPGRRAELIGPLAMLLAGALGLLVILALPGGWKLDGLAAALAARSGFYLFIAFSCLFAAAGLSGLMRQLLGPAGGRWQAAFLFFLAAIALLYFLLAWRVNDDAWRAVLVTHAAMGGALLLAVLAKIIYSVFGGRAMQTCWAALLLMTAVQLLAYREAAVTFGPHIETLRAGPLLSPQQQNAIAELLKPNAKPADKKRSGN